MTSIVIGQDGKSRCAWSDAAPDFVAYHDTEWGLPVTDDRQLFEKMCLESFQSGLSWRTILAKRESFRKAFHEFDFNRVARFSNRDVERLLGNEAIVRHRGKIEAVINNAKRTRELVAHEGSLAAFVWRFEPAAGSLGAPQSQTTCAEAQALAKELKKRGFRFVGPTTVFAFMQAMGLVNDHAADCYLRKRVETARRKLERPR